jgi:GDPmannose 4,6-dehydratase
MGKLLNTKKAIIVGSNGQDGKILSNFLTKKSYQIVKLNKDNFDINNFKSVESLIKAEIPNEIYFLAAFHNSSEDLLVSEHELFHKSIEINTLALINFLESIRKHSLHTKLFYASSSLIFESNEIDLINENSIIKPNCPYSISKVAASNACKMYRENHNVYASVGILFNHESYYRKKNFVSKKISTTIIDILKGHKNEIIMGNLNSIVDWGYAEDFVNAMYLILQLEIPDDFIIATGNNNSIKDYLFHAFNHVGLNYLDYVKSNPNFLTRKNTVRIGDSSKLKSLTGWEPSVSFPEMVTLLLEEELVANNLTLNNN